MKLIKNNDAAKKMGQRPIRSSNGESRSQAVHEIQSGWQGSDEDEDVNIDSSDDEKAFAVQRKRPSNRPAREIRAGRDRSFSSSHSGRSGTGPGGGSVMKVKSSDARRFRKELTANQSGAKMAVIPRCSPNEPSMKGSLGNEERDRRNDAAVEDLEEGEVSPGKSPDIGDERRSVKQGQPKDAGAGEKADQEQRINLTETRKKKGRDSKETSEKDDEESRKRRYRELEQAQLAADRKLTLRERPESRQRDDVLRRELITRGNLVGRRLRTAGRSTPQETDTVGRSLSENELVPSAPDKMFIYRSGIGIVHGRSDRRVTSKISIDSISTTPSKDKHESKKRDMSTTPPKDKRSEKKGGDAEGVEKSFETYERRSTRRSTENLEDTSPSKLAAETVSVSRTGSKDDDADMGQDETVENIPVVVPLLQAVVSEEQSMSAMKTGSLSMAGTESVEKSLTSTEKSYKDTVVEQQEIDYLDDSGRNVLARAHEVGGSDQAEDNASALEKSGVDQQAGAITPAGTVEKSSDGVAVDDRTRPARKEISSFCTEALDHLIKGASLDVKNLYDGRQQRFEEDKNGEEEKRLVEIDHNLQTVETEEAAVSVDIDMGPKEGKEDKEILKRKRRNSADCTDIRVPEIEECHKTKRRSVFQVLEDTVEDRESRWLRFSEGVPSTSLQRVPLGAANLTVEDGKSNLILLQKTSAQNQPSLSRTGFEGPELEGEVDQSIDEYNAPGIRSAASLLKEGSLSNLHNDGCCDASGCKVTYHLECADPSMTEVPKGKWYCPSCTQKRLSFGVNASLKAVESIWDVRDCTCHSCSGSPGVTLDQNKNVSRECSGMIHGVEDRLTHLSDHTMKDQERGPGVVDDCPSSSSGIPQRLTRRKLMELESRRQSEKCKTDMVTSMEGTSSLMAQSANGLRKGCDKQYFVKYKNLSHIHNAWVCENELKKAAPKMLEGFRKKLESDSLNQGRIKWQPNWQVPQRFLLRRLNAPPRRLGGGRGRGYLGMDSGLEWFVKWLDLGYEHCTWEPVNSGLLDSEISKRLESDYDRWCEGARRRSHPARIEEVMRLREADFKPLDKQPDWFQGYKLSDHQLEELNGLRERWHHHHNTLMVDESDQERTRTAVAFLLSLIEEYGSFKPILVIVPLNGCQMWESELLRSAEHVYTVVYTGSTSGRSVIQRHELNPSEKPIKFQIVLTTFEIANSDHDHLGKFEWEAVILDEGHRSRITKSYRHLQFLAPYRLILLNDFSNVCTVTGLQQFLVYLEPEDHSLESESQKQWGELDEDNQLNFLKGKLTEKMVGDIRSDETSRLEFKEHWIPGKMTQTQVHQYCTELSKHYNLLFSGRMRSDQDSTLSDLIGNLRKVCNHPFLHDPHLQQDLLSNLKPSQSLLEAGIQLCGKFETLQGMVSHLHANGRRVILLCQTDKLCIYFDDYMRQIFGADSYECVSKGSDAVKNQAVQRFNAEGSTRFVLILRKNTAGVSLQLRETDAVIVYDSDWNPANDLQYLEKVIYKVQGQLSIYRLYTPLSVEEAAIVYSRQRRLDVQRGLRLMTAKYCQQILKWKVKEVLELDDIHNRRIRGSEKIYMTEFTEEVLKARAEHAELVKKILDGAIEADALSLNEEIPEEDGEALKEFWSAMLRDRYAGLQFEELTDRKRPRRQVHYSEEALALASYAAANEEEVRRKRRKLQGSELVQRGSPRANIVQPCILKPAALVDSSSTDEILPASLTAKEVNDLDVAPQEPVEATTVVVAENTTSVGAEGPRQAEEERPETQPPMSQREELPGPSGKASTKSAGGINSTASEEGRKTRSEQQQIMLGLWRPYVTKFCKTLELSESIATYADQLLVYCMKSYRMPKEPRDLVLQVQIALCVVAAERFHQEIDHQTSLSRVEEAMDVKLKRESWSDNYQKFVSLCKEYPLPSTAPVDTEQNIQAQPAAALSDTSSESKSTDDEPSLPTPMPSPEIPKSSLPSQDVDKPPVLQTPDCFGKAHVVDEQDSPSDQRNQPASSAATGSHVDQRQIREVDKELQPAEIPEVPSTLPAQTEDSSAISVPEVQGVVENEILQSTVSQADKEQIHEKLKTERHEINSVVMYQQTQELNEFYRSRAAERQDMLKRNNEKTAEMKKTVVEPEQQTDVLRKQREEDLRKFELDHKEQHEMLVRSQRMIRDEIHSVYSELLRQADAGSSRSLYEEAQSILAKIGVKSVAEAQSILNAVADDVRRKKAAAACPQGSVGQVRSQIDRTLTQSQAPRIGQSQNPTQAVQRVSLPQSVAQAGAPTQPQPLHVTQLSQSLPSQPPVLSEIHILQPPSQSQPPLTELQQSAALPSQVSQLTPRNPLQPEQPNISSGQAREVHHPLPPRPTVLPRQHYVPVPENAQSPHHQLPVSSPHVPVADSTPSLHHQHVGRTHNVQPSPSTQQQWTTQARQPQGEEQRNLQTRRLQASTIPRQQPVWHTSSTRQGYPTYSRQKPQPQQTSNQVHSLPSTVVSPSATQVNPLTTPNNVAQFTQAMVTFLPAIPTNMLGPDPILQEEARLKKEREKIRAAHEQKAAELKMQYAREVEDAQRKFEALMAEMKKKLDGLLDENFQTYNQQNLVIQQTHIKVHRSRLLAEALRNRGMFDVAYQPRNTAQQGDETASGSGQMRNIHSGTAYTGPSSRAQVQAAQQSVLPMRHTAANEVIFSTPSGQFVNAASPAGRALLQTYQQNSAVASRNVSASQREMSTASVQGVTPSVVAVPPAPSLGGLTPQNPHQSSLYHTEDVEGQRNEIALGSVQLSNNPSPGTRLPVPPAAGRTPAPPPHSNSSPGSAYPGSLNVVSNVPGRGPPVATTVLSSGRVSGLGGASGVGLWLTCNPNSITRPGSFVPLMGSPSVLMPSQTSTTGSITMSVSTPSPLSSGLGQPTSDNPHRSHPSTSLNSGNVNLVPTASLQRRSWSVEGTGNMTSHSTTGRMGSQPSLIHLEGSSDSVVPMSTNVAPAERLPVVTEAVLVSVNPSGPNVGMPESCALGDWSSLALPPPTPHPALSAMASREPDLGGVAAMDGPSRGLLNHSNVPANASRPDVQIIYLSDDE